jgi:hypothetical protein
MSQHVPETCNESNGNWLPITEYSVKSGMSLSTIRRKIKSNSIAFRLEKGKYLILLENEDQVKQPIDSATTVSPVSITHRNQHDGLAMAKLPSHQEKRESIVRFEQDDDAFHMVTDAYEHALHEKNERIKLLEKRNKELEDRLNELRLLVQVLEEKYEVRY